MRRQLFYTFLLSISTLHASPDWYWQGKFSLAEQDMLMEWVEEADTSVEKLFGPLPYNFNVYFYQQEGSEPVPWAHTTKGIEKSVHFYVSMAHTKEEFIDDWTVYHELAHLLFPYLGSNSAWFAEGIASYLQYQFMYANNVITWNEGVNKLKERFRRARIQHIYDDISITQLSEIFKQTKAYVRLYWGGAAYFANVDMRLFNEQGIRLNNVIYDYLKCCAKRRVRGAQNMIRLFDDISNSTIFSEVFDETVNHKGFPATHQAVVWLRNHPPPFYSQLINLRSHHQ
ncbi:MAG: hypothetical protein AAGB35_05070 [Pseudomonadota bacterium]